MAQNRQQKLYTPFKAIIKKKKEEGNCAQIVTR